MAVWDIGVTGFSNILGSVRTFSLMRALAATDKIIIIKRLAVKMTLLDLIVIPF